MYGLGHPVKSYVREQFVFGEFLFDIAIAVSPIAEFLDDPRGQSYRRIIQGIGKRLRRGPL